MRNIRGIITLTIAIILIPTAIGLAVSWKWKSEGDLNITTTSPQGNYHVKIEGKTKPKDASPGEFFVKKVGLEAFRETERVFSDESFYSEDPYELSFLQAYPKYEWLNNSTLRLGESGLKQPFQDEIAVTNNTGNNLDFLIVRYGKYEVFLIFDMAPGARLQLEASPQFDKQWPVSTVSYSAYFNQKSIKGSAGVDKRNASEGSLKILVDIKN